MSVLASQNVLLTNSDMSVGLFSDSIELHRKTSYSIHVIFTGAPAGSVYIAVSIDGVNWKVLDNSATAINAAGDIFFNITTAGYLFARLHYAFTSGTGTLNAFYSTKGF